MWLTNLCYGNKNLEPFLIYKLDLNLEYLSNSHD